jgi:protein gp37
LSGPIRFGIRSEDVPAFLAGVFNCYAERIAARFSDHGQPYEGLARRTPQGPRWTGDIMLVPEKLEEPLHWKKPCMIFVNSMSDFFHEGVSFEYIEQMCSVMELATAMHGHIFQVLTKRPERMFAFFGTKFGKNFAAMQHKKIWWGVSVEDQKTADKRIEALLDCPVAMRWLSVEPLLGPVSIAAFLRCNCGLDPKNDQFAPPWGHAENCPYRTRLSWIVVGGESGPGARPMQPEWARLIRDQCIVAGVPFFFKQHGDWVSAGKPFKDDNFYGGWAVNDPSGGRVSVEWATSTRGGKFSTSGEVLIRVGKKNSGHELDGKIWQQFPETE